MPHSIQNHSGSDSNFRAYSSVFNSTYDTSPSSSSSDTNRDQSFHHSLPRTGVASNISFNELTSRMPHHPLPQPQQNTENGNHYNTSYSGHHISNSNRNSSNGPQPKIVYRMDCRYCSAVICLRGMRAMLLADTSIELYSTDHPPGSVQLIDKSYTTPNCKCKIRDVACRVCGNVVGYHIAQPCQQCLKAPNNGHFWMFHAEEVIGHGRVNMDLNKLAQELIRLLASKRPHGSDYNASREHADPSNTFHPYYSTTRPTSFLGAQRLRNPVHQPEQSIATTNSSSPVTPRLSTYMPNNPTTVMPSIPLVPDSIVNRQISTASSVLEKLSVSQFLKPVTWDQLPHPDLDIDLDPSALDDEPFFAEQWTDMVMRTAEAAAANMWLALGQEKEEERYLERMAGYYTIPQANGRKDGESGGGFECEIAMEEGHRESVEQLVDQIDGFSLPSSLPVAEDHKNEEDQNVVNNIEHVGISGEERGLVLRQQDAQPNALLAPWQEDISLCPPSASAVSDRNVGLGHHGSISMSTADSRQYRSWPAFALSSVMAARAAASAAAADATSAVNSLLYARRVRRDYDMMCR